MIKYNFIFTLITLITLITCSCSQRLTFQGNPKNSISPIENGGNSGCNPSLNPYGGGDGTETNPYQICSTAQFLAVNQNLSSFYIQKTDLDFSGVTFNPIGTNTTPFTGQYNGNEKTISHITYENTNVTDTVGIFNKISNAKISNLKLNQINIKTNQDFAIGTLIGLAEQSYLNKIYVSQSEVNGIQRTGGIIGDALNSRIIECSFEGNVTNTGTSSFGAGGIAGRFMRTNFSADIDIQLCKSSGTLTHPFQGNGGIAGDAGMYDLTSFIRLDQVRSDMTINAKSWSGGIVGDFMGVITHASFTGSINTLIQAGYGGRTGGIAANSYGASEIKYSFSDHYDAWRYNASHAGLVGYVYNGTTTLIDSFTAGNANKICNARSGATCSISGATALTTTAQLKDASFYPIAPSPWRDTSIWSLISGSLPNLVGL